MFEPSGVEIVVSWQCDWSGYIDWLKSKLVSLVSCIDIDLCWNGCQCLDVVLCLGLVVVSDAAIGDRDRGWI